MSEEIPVLSLRLALECFMAIYPTTDKAPVEERIKRGFRTVANNIHNKPRSYADALNIVGDVFFYPGFDWDTAERLGKSAAIEYFNTKLNKQLHGVCNDT